MAVSFDVNAKLKFQGPSNLKSTVSKVRSAFSNIKADLTIKTGTSANSIQGIGRSITSLNARISAATPKVMEMSVALKSLSSHGKINVQINTARSASSLTTLTRAVTAFDNSITKALPNVSSFNTALLSMSNVIHGVQGNFSQLAGSAKQVAQAINTVNTHARSGGKSVQTFYELLGETSRRFASFGIVAGVFSTFLLGAKQAIGEAVQFDRELIRVKQVTGETGASIKSLNDTVTNLSTSLGVSSLELLKAATTLRQAGLSATETKSALKVLAESQLTPNFDDLEKTTEGLIAIRSQFKDIANDPKKLSEAFDAISKSSAAFAFESSDVIDAVIKSGGAFHAAGGSLKEFIALFGAVRSTTRESADTIATGIKTISARLQRPKTQQKLKLEYGIDLKDAKGNFIGIWDAAKKINLETEKMNTLSPKFAGILEEVGGIKQISKTLPLIREMGLAQEIYNSQLDSTNSITKDANAAQEALIVKLTKLQEKFKELFRVILESKGFRSLLDLIYNITDGVLMATKAFGPLVGILSAVGSIRLGAGLAGAFAIATKMKSNKGIGSEVVVNTANLFKGFFKRAKGGIVPGSGDTDSVPAFLPSGSFVINKKSTKEMMKANALLTPGEAVFSPEEAKQIGYEKLKKLNKLASGGEMGDGDPIEDESSLIRGIYNKYFNKNRRRSSGKSSSSDNGHSINDESRLIKRLYNRHVANRPRAGNVDNNMVPLPPLPNQKQIGSTINNLKQLTGPGPDHIPLIPESEVRRVASHPDDGPEPFVTSPSGVTYRPGEFFGGLAEDGVKARAKFGSLPRHMPEDRSVQEYSESVNKVRPGVYPDDVGLVPIEGPFTHSNHPSAELPRVSRDRLVSKSNPTPIIRDRSPEEIVQRANRARYLRHAKRTGNFNATNVANEMRAAGEGVSASDFDDMQFQAVKTSVMRDDAYFRNVGRIVNNAKPAENSRIKNHLTTDSRADISPMNGGTKRVEPYKVDHERGTFSPPTVTEDTNPIRTGMSRISRTDNGDVIPIETNPQHIPSNVDNGILRPDDISGGRGHHRSMGLSHISKEHIDDGSRGIEMPGAVEARNKRVTFYREDDVQPEVKPKKRRPKPELSMADFGQFDAMSDETRRASEDFMSRGKKPARMTLADRFERQFDRVTGGVSNMAGRAKNMFYRDVQPEEFTGSIDDMLKADTKKFSATQPIRSLFGSSKRGLGRLGGASKSGLKSFMQFARKPLFQRAASEVVQDAGSLLGSLSSDGSVESTVSSVAKGKGGILGRLFSSAGGSASAVSKAGGLLGKGKGLAGALFGKGIAGAVISAAAPAVLNSTVGTAEDVANGTGSYKAAAGGSMASTAASYASFGAMAGPVGAVVGGLVGAARGLETFNDDLNKIKLDKFTNEIDKSLTDIENNKKLDSEDKRGEFSKNISGTIEGIAKSREGGAAADTDMRYAAISPGLLASQILPSLKAYGSSAVNFVTRGSYGKGFQESLDESANAQEEVNQQARREQALPQYERLTTILANKISTSHMTSTQLKKDSETKPLFDAMKKFEMFMNKEDISKAQETLGNADKSAKAAQDLAAQSKALAEAEKRLMEKTHDLIGGFDKFVMGIDGAVEKLGENFAIQGETHNAFNGKIGFGTNLSDLGGFGRVGTELKEFSKTGGGYEQARESLRNAFKKAGNGNDTEISGDVVDAIDGKKGFTGVVGGQLKDIVKEHLATNGGETIRKFNSGDQEGAIDDALEKVGKDLYSKSQKATAQIAKAMEMFGRAAVDIAEQENQINASRVEEIGIGIDRRANQAQTIAQLNDGGVDKNGNIITKEAAMANINSDVQNEKFNTNQIVRFGVSGWNPQMAGGISAQLEEAQFAHKKALLRQRDLKEQNRPMEEQDTAMNDVVQTSSAVANLMDGLKNLANSTELVAAAQGKLNVAIDAELSDKAARRSDAETLTFGSAKDRQQLFRAQHLQNIAAQQGSLNGFNDADKQLVLNRLKTNSGQDNAFQKFDRFGRQRGVGHYTNAQLYEQLIGQNTRASSLEQTTVDDGSGNKTRVSKGVAEGLAAVNAQSTKRQNAQMALTNFQRTDQEDKRAQLEANKKNFEKQIEMGMPDFKPLENAVAMMNKSPLVDALNSFPQSLKVEQNGTIQVVFNGAEVLTSIRDNLGDQITARVMKQMQEQLPQMLKGVPA